MSDEIVVDLDPEQRQLLYGRSRRMERTCRTDRRDRPMGFTSRSALADQAGQLPERLTASLPMTAVDWARALPATEIALASDDDGSGRGWQTTPALTMHVPSAASSTNPSASLSSDHQTRHDRPQERTGG